MTYCGGAAGVQGGDGFGEAAEPAEALQVGVIDEFWRKIPRMNR